MAKKQTAEKKDAKAPAEKSVLAKAAGKVAEVVSKGAVAVQDHVLQPVAEAVGIVKKKQPRVVRQKKSAMPPARSAPLARSTSAAGKMMSKNVKHPAKQKPAPGKGPEGGSKR